MADPTLFFRLLAHEDKGAALAEALAAVQTGLSDHPAVHRADTRSLRQVPGSPFAYWVSEALRRKFVELPCLASAGREPRVGLQTSDDLRFVRAWWEVAPTRTLDGAAADSRDDATFQQWCRERTLGNKRWVPFAKGGEYSPYFADLHLVVNWENDGEEIRNFVDTQTGRSYSRPQNTDYYFRSGLTWPRTPWKRGSFFQVPFGCIFADKGPMLFVLLRDHWATLGILNSDAYIGLLHLVLGRGGQHTQQTLIYEVGRVSAVPMPLIEGDDGERLTDHTRAGFDISRDLDRANQTSHVFDRPALLRVNGHTLEQRLAAWEGTVAEARNRLAEIKAEIDEIAFRLYGIAGQDRAALVASLQDEEGVAVASDDDDSDAIVAADDERAESPEEAEVTTVTDRRPLVADLLAYAVGCAFGRWEVRLATGERTAPDLPDPFAPLPVCSPGMLQGEDGLPLDIPPDGYPLRVAQDGILVDDSGQDGNSPHADDVARRVHVVLELVWGDRVDAIEREACATLGVRELRDYFHNPRGFWDYHVKRYSKSQRKAPIYWLLQSGKRSYGLWLYYHRLDRDTVFVALRQYVEPKLNGEVARLREMRAELDRERASLARRQQTEREKAIDRQEALIAELGAFKQALERVADLGYDPDLDDGVVLNAAPFREMMPWREAKAYWDDLQAGKYAWSMISRRLRARGAIGPGG